MKVANFQGCSLQKFPQHWKTVPLQCLIWFWITYSEIYLHQTGIQPVKVKRLWKPTIRDKHSSCQEKTKNEIQRFNVVGASPWVSYVSPRWFCCSPGCWGMRFVNGRIFQVGGIFCPPTSMLSLHLLVLHCPWGRGQYGWHDYSLPPVCLLFSGGYSLTEKTKSWDIWLGG